MDYPKINGYPEVLKVKTKVDHSKKLQDKREKHV